MEFPVALRILTNSRALQSGQDCCPHDSATVPPSLISRWQPCPPTASISILYWPIAFSFCLLDSLRSDLPAEGESRLPRPAVVDARLLEVAGAGFGAHVARLADAPLVSTAGGGEQGVQLAAVLQAHRDVK